MNIRSFTDCSLGQLYCVALLRRSDSAVKATNPITKALSNAGDFSISPTVKSNVNSYNGGMKIDGVAYRSTATISLNRFL